MSSKSVRFTASAEVDERPSEKRRREDYAEGSEPPQQPKKRYRQNEDELDDIDDWKQEDDGEEDNGRIVLSEKVLLEAKRERRQKRDEIMHEGGTQIDETTSLATEGIPIEPFHMQQEETDGTGFFDGDTYVFRKSNPDEEPDAWLETLNEQNKNGRQSSTLTPIPKTKTKEEPLECMENGTKEQLYRKILPLVCDTETVSQAVRRYGRLVKHKKGGKHGTKTSPETQDMAKTCLNDLTGAASALLLKGEVDIYDTTRQSILNLLPQEPQKPFHPTEKQPAAQWEYLGNQDGNIHGPYTTEQVIGWTQTGYFVGEQRVKIRTIREEQLSTKDDLLADLLGEDEDDNDADATKENGTIKGEWLWSNEVSFRAYLPGG
jgi:CD2 antigen cytoplasmic tail-binding protein 2